MSNARSLVSIVLLSALAAACTKAPASAARQGTAPKPVETRPAGALTSQESRDLCLADPGDSRPESKPLRAATALAGKRAQPNDWVKAGDAWIRKARLSSDPGFYVNANACATVALALEADFLPALALHGLALMNDHKFAEAQALADQILERDPEDVLALGLRSDALLELGRYDESAQAAQRQMSLSPGMAAHSRGSYLRWLKGDTGRAKLLIKNALIGRDAADPEPAAWTFVEAAAIFWQEADYAGADAIYAEALKWVPDYPAALVGRARIALARKDPRTAIGNLEKAYAARPLVETAWLLGDARAMTGDVLGARNAYDEAVRQGRRGDRFTLAYFYAVKNRDSAEAVRLIEEERRSRGGVYVDDVYSWVLYRAGHLTEARQASDRARSFGTQDARLFYHAGAIRVAAGDAAGGRALIERALALNQGFDSSQAAEARALLETPLQKLASN